jgi:iron(III) transport system ATP-binding protein
MRVLEVRAVSKRYGGAATLAVRGVSLEVTRGEVLALVGESGSGKTTLLRLVAGLEVPTEGEVLLNGHLASSPEGCVPPELRGVGIVFQDYALFPHLPVAANVAFGLRSLRRGARVERAMETLALVGMQEYARRYPHELSGGQQQRVALARALAPRPALLLLDEPFSNLDVMLREQVREEVAQILRATATTALFVVHDLEDVLAVADRIAILKDGTLQQIGAPREIYARPADPYVARLFGSTNILPAAPVPGGWITAIGRIAAPTVDGGGGTVVLSIRPEDLELGPPGPDTTPATVRRTHFRGDHLVAVVTVAGPDGAAHELRVRLPAEGDVRPGDVLHLRPVVGAVRLLG